MPRYGKSCESFVQELLGHANIGITLDTYSHVLPSMQAEAVRAFDELFPVGGA